MLGIYAAGRGRLQRLCFAPAKATSHRFGFRPWEWLHPPGLGAAEEVVANDRQIAGAASNAALLMLGSYLSSSLRRFSLEHPSARHSDRFLL